MKPEYKPFVDELIELCIREDIGDGDHTSLSCIPADEHGRMRLLCKQDLCKKSRCQQTAAFPFRVVFKKS